MLTTVDNPATEARQSTGSNSEVDDVNSIVVLLRKGVWEPSGKWNQHGGAPAWIYTPAGLKFGVHTVLAACTTGAFRFFGRVLCFNINVRVS